MTQQFEVVFPRVLDMVAAGWTYGRALKELRVEPPIDVGLFIRWLKKKPKLYELYKEAKEIRTEEWASRIISHAEASEQGFENDVARSSLIINTYKWLMGADNRKQYGESKQIEVNQNISVRAAMDLAQTRVSQIIDVDAETVDQLLLPEGYDEND